MTTGMNHVQHWKYCIKTVMSLSPSKSDPQVLMKGMKLVCQAVFAMLLHSTRFFFIPFFTFYYFSRFESDCPPYDHPNFLLRDWYMDVVSGYGHQTDLGTEITYFMWLLVFIKSYHASSDQRQFRRVLGEVACDDLQMIVISEILKSKLMNFY